MAIFQHANIKTPRWIGYLIQRPESHSIHHGRGIHAYNYSGLPIYDILFGTFKNPKDYVNETGFYDGASSQILEMMQFKDISSKSS
jgi:sterol desaturase/sphingolipid hydroxylase (fatty acid hydroxylase superfamily)